MGSVMSIFRKKQNSRGIPRTSSGGSSSNPSITARTASYGSSMFRKPSMSETSGSKPDQGTEKKKLSTQKKQKYAYIPDNFSTLEQIHKPAVRFQLFNPWTKKKVIFELLFHECWLIELLDWLCSRFFEHWGLPPSNQDSNFSWSFSQPNVSFTNMLHDQNYLAHLNQDFFSTGLERPQDPKE